MRIPVLDLSDQYQSLKSEIDSAIQEVLDSTYFINGPQVKSLEQEICNYMQCKYAIGVNSGTDALVIGLRACGVEPGDEVLTTSFSFFATAESISNIGAHPVFIDIDGESFNLDEKLLASKLTSKTKAIMPVHLYGRPCVMDEIKNFAKENNLKIIEDCAQAFGAQFKSKRLGTFGEVGAFSFFPSKNLGAYGDGGMIITQDAGIAETCQKLRAHGGKVKYQNEILGYNSRLDTIQAAILLVKLQHIDRWNEARRNVARAYNEFLANHELIQTPKITDGHVFHQYTVRIGEGYRRRVQDHLKAEGIGSMIYYPTPQHKLPVYAGRFPSLSVTERTCGEVLSLPIWPEMSLQTVEEVSQTILHALEA